MKNSFALSSCDTPLSSRSVTAGSILDCENLSFYFARQNIFSNLSFILEQACALSVVGSNGSGKTTLLKVISGLLRPARGRVMCLGEEIWPRKYATYEHKSLYLAHHPSFYLDQTVSANLDFYLNCYSVKCTRNERVHALKHVGLLRKENEAVRHLSTGQQRRLTLAILLLLKPRLVCADEPTNGLDAEGVDLCRQVFSTLMKNEKTSFVIATHDSHLKQWSQRELSLHDFKS